MPKRVVAHGAPDEGTKMRRLEQQTTYGTTGLKDEWHPFDATGTDHAVEVSRLDTDKDFRDFVTKFNRDAKARGDNTRLRSVADED